MNSIHVIAPYKWRGLWVFDDEAVGLRREPFVSTFHGMIDKAVLGVIPNAEDGFVLLFSDAPFPGCEYTLNWIKEHNKGNIYYCVEMHAEGWLCPALLKYFTVAPMQIYAQLKRAS
jgi:hypothetical protein